MAVIGRGDQALHDQPCMPRSRREEGEQLLHPGSARARPTKWLELIIGQAVEGDGELIHPSFEQVEVDLPRSVTIRLDLDGTATLPCEPHQIGQAGVERGLPPAPEQHRGLADLRIVEQRPQRLGAQHRGGAAGLTAASRAEGTRQVARGGRLDQDEVQGGHGIRSCGSEGGGGALGDCVASW